MIHLAICDDQQEEILALSTLVSHWASTRGLALGIAQYRSAESFLFAYADERDVDILLLDIQMPGMDGVSLARQIRRENKEIQMIFITGYMEYIADGYEVEALHYLIKPVTGEKLGAILDRALEKLARNGRALLISQAGESVRIPLYEIRYLAVYQNYVTIQANQAYTVKRSLGDMEKDLDDGFFRTSRSHIVNLRYVRKSTKNEVYLADGVVIPLSRGLYEALNRALIQRL